MQTIKLPVDETYYEVLTYNNHDLVAEHSFMSKKDGCLAKEFRFYKKMKGKTEVTILRCHKPPFTLNASNEKEVIEVSESYIRYMGKQVLQSSLLHLFKGVCGHRKYKRNVSESPEWSLVETRLVKKR